MPRYVVQRTLPQGCTSRSRTAAPELCRQIVERNAEAGVTWISWFVSEYQTRTFCIYE